MKTARFMGQPVLYLPIGCNDSGNNTIIPAFTGYSIYLLSILLVVADDVDVYLKSSGDDELVGKATHPLHLAGNDGFSSNWSEYGITCTNESEGLILHLSAAVSVSGALVYVLVP